jgi:hypothetical protein
MKYTYIIPLLLFSAMAYAADGPRLNDRESLKFIFGASSEEVSTSLNDTDFLIHLKGVDYTLATIADQSEVEWTSKSSPDLTGKVVMLSTKLVNGVACKNFMEVLNIKGKKYEGNGIVCLKEGYWLIDK